MSGARADVLIVGAGAAGGVVGRRLAEAGMDVLCLEQGDVAGPQRLSRGRRPDWELQAMKQWSPDPNVRGGPADYPVDVSASDIVPLMYSAVGGSMVLYAGDWPRLTPSDFRVRSLDGVADDWPLDYEELEPYYDRIARQIGVAGFAGDPAYPAGADLPLPPLPLGRRRDGRRARARPAGLALVAGAERDPLRAVRGAPRVRRLGRVHAGLPRGREGARPTSPTGRGRSPAAPGCVTGARVTRLLLGPRRARRPAPSTSTPEGRTARAEADVVVLAANAVGTARLLLLSAGGAFPDGLANSQRPGRAAADDAPVRRRHRRVPASRWRRGAGNVGSRIHSLQFYETRRAPRLRAGRQVEPRAVDRRPAQRRACPPAPGPPSGAPSTTSACASASGTA